MRTRITLSLLACAALMLFSSVACVAEDAARPPEAGQNKTLNLQFKDMPLADALDAMFKGTGYSYTIDQSLKDLKVTAVLKDIPFDQALKQVAKAVGAFYHMDGNTYSFSAKAAPQTGPVPLSGQGIETRVITLLYLDADDAVFVVTGPEVQARAVGDKKLVLRGKSKALDAAVAQVKGLDEESTAAKTVRLKISITESSPASGKALAEYEAYLDAADGRQAKMVVAKAVPVSGKARAGEEAPGFTISATPSIKDDKHVMLQIELMFGGGNDANGFLKTQRLLESGVPMVLGAFPVADEDTKEVRNVTVTATGTIGKSAVRVPPAAAKTAKPPTKSVPAAK